MNTQEVIYEYEQALLGKKKNIDGDVFRYSSYGNELLALDVFKYAIENIMHWTPDEAYNGLNGKVIDLLRLRHLVKFVSFPPEFDPDKDFYYIVSKIYPDKIKINIKKRTLIMYQQILSGKIKKFPKRFVEGRDGEMRAIFCLKYAIRNYGTFESTEDLYRAFSDSAGIEFLKKVKLYLPCTTLFDYPIDFLHATFSKDEQAYNQFIYSMYKFRAYDRQQTRKRKVAESVNKSDN